MIILLLKCPKCNHEFELEPLGDFEDEIECEKCGYCNESWNFPHKPIAYYTRHEIENPPSQWEIGDHYPNDALELSLSRFMEFFDKKNVDTHAGLVNAVISSFTQNSEFKREGGEKAHER